MGLNSWREAIIALMVFNGLALSLCQSLDVFFFGGNELVERGIKETDGNRVPSRAS